MEKLDALEVKIQRATDVIRKLREERGILENQLRTAREASHGAAAREDESPLREELARLTRERQMIAERVERLISLIEEVETVTQAEGV